MINKSLDLRNRVRETTGLCELLLKNLRDEPGSPGADWIVNKAKVKRTRITINEMLIKLEKGEL